MTRVRRLGVLLLLASGCGDTEVPAAAPEVPRFVGAIDLEIGEVTGEDPYLFTAIGAVVADPDQRLIVADLRSHEVRVFDPSGRYLFHFGGQGEGPGELTGPCCLGFSPDGLLWVRENGRYSAFQLESEGVTYSSGLRSRHMAVNFHAPVTFDSTGRLIDIGPIRIPGQDNILARLHMDPSGGIDTVPMPAPPDELVGVRLVPSILNGRQRIAYVYQPFGPRWLHAHGPGGLWAEALSAEYVVTVHLPNGNSLELRGQPSPGPRLSPVERDRAQEAIEADIERADLREHPFGIPDNKPPLANLFFDRTGRLWVEKTGADGDESREADVYEPDGSLVARYRWPRRVRNGTSPWVTETELYGTTRDSLDVQRAARVRFVPEG